MNNSLRLPTIFGILTLIVILFFIGLGSARAPLLFSFALSYLLFPVIIKIEQYGVKRIYALLSVFSSLLIILAITLMIIIPNLIADGQQLFHSLPTIAEKSLNQVDTVTQQMGYSFQINGDQLKSYFLDNISTLSASILKAFSLTLKTGMTSVSKWLIFIMNLFLAPLFFFYLISDYEKIVSEIKSFIPHNIKTKLDGYLKQSNTILSGYIRGQLVVAFIQAILYATLLSLVGIKFGLIIGVLTGLLSLIPYIGFTMGLTASIGVSLTYTHSLSSLVAVVAIFLFMQLIESFILTPKLVGNKVGLNALATMLALIIGGNFLGVLGMLIAVPFAAIVWSLLQNLKKEYQ